MCWSCGEKDAKILFVWGYCKYSFSYGINWHATKVRKYLQTSLRFPFEDLNMKSIELTFKKYLDLLSYRIHCSEECRNLLEDIGGYNLEKRGFVNLKV